jgi:hypothetical protein
MLILQSVTSVTKEICYIFTVGDMNLHNITKADILSSHSCYLKAGNKETVRTLYSCLFIDSGARSVNHVDFQT